MRGKNTKEGKKKEEEKEDKKKINMREDELHNDVTSLRLGNE